MHNHHRRQFLQAGLALGAAGLAPAAFAQGAANYPAKPVRWIIPTSPGAGTDAAGRIFAQLASETWKQSVVPDNRAGASGMLGLDAVAAAAADGYTLGFFSVSQFIDATLLGKYSFEPNKDFTPISSLASTPLILLAHPDAGVTTAQQMIAKAKAAPNAMNYASGGAGGLTHLAMEVFLKRAGIDVAHIPYKGSGPAVIDLLAGRVQFAQSTPPAVLQHVKTGRLRALAVTSDARLASLPDVPTMAELGFPTAAISTWYGLFGPANMPPDLVDRIARSITAAARPLREKIAASGVDPVLSSPAEFLASLRKERDQLQNVVKMIGFKKDS